MIAKEFLSRIFIMHDEIFGKFLLRDMLHQQQLLFGRKTKAPFSAGISVAGATPLTPGWHGEYVFKEFFAS